MKAIVRLLAILLLALHTQAVFAQTDISSCGAVITSSGTYLVTQDLINTFEACISVDATDVTVDCQGYRLTGDGTGDGIWVTNNSKGVIIRNCDIYSFQHGLHYRGDNGVVEGNKLVDNGHGIRLSQGYGDEVRWNTGINNVYGMWIDLSYNDNYIYENTFHRNDYGLYCNRGARNYFIANQLNHNNLAGLGFHSNCFDNSIWHNTANLNNNGFSIQSSSSGNDFYKNVLNRNDSRGIYVGNGGATSTLNNYEDNVCKNNGTEPSNVAGACK